MPGLLFIHDGTGAVMKNRLQQADNRTFCEVQESTSFYSFIIKLHKQLELVQYLRVKITKKVLVTFTKIILT